MSELRQDLITKQWVIISEKRGYRPHQFKLDLVEDKRRKCVFCDPDKSGQKKATRIIYDQQGSWQVRAFPNLYPALKIGKNLDPKMEGPFKFENAIGFHEVIATREHHKSIGLMNNSQVGRVIKIYRERYIDLMNRKFVRYIAIFHNHGKTAGASVAHPHSQLIAIPEVPMDIQTELKGAADFYQANRQCGYCLILSYEDEDEERIVWENDEIAVFCPFASRGAYEVWIMPKKHQPYFERSDKDRQEKIAEALKVALFKIHKLLDNPDYNFYIHTAPCDGRFYPSFHWHIEILPKVSVWAGFELSTGIEINPILPEVAARELRQVKFKESSDSLGQKFFSKLFRKL